MSAEKQAHSGRVAQGGFLMSGEKLNRRGFLRGAAMAAVGLAAASCAQPTPQVIEKPITVVVEKEVEVEKEVVRTVVVEKEVPVEKVVQQTVVVEQEKVVKETVVVEKEKVV
ncbi:MAG: twin-arginine translocation signal domain-containing protein [Anaerolineae bacterium]